MSDNWDFYFSNVNDKIASIMVDLGISSPDSSRHHLLWIFVRFNTPRPDGLSSQEEFERLANIEDVMVPEIERGCSANHVGRITTSGHREFYFYCEDPTPLEQITEGIFRRFPDYLYQIGARTDPAWDHYFGLLKPSDREMQAIQNRRTIDALEREGDISQIPREIAHWVYFRNVADRKLFRSKLDKAVFWFEDLQGIEAAFPVGLIVRHTNTTDYTTMNQQALALYDFALACDGDYDGWETSVERAE